MKNTLTLLAAVFMAVFFIGCTEPAGNVIKDIDNTNDNNGSETKGDETKDEMKYELPKTLLEIWEEISGQPKGTLYQPGIWYPGATGSKNEWVSFNLRWATEIIDEDEIVEYPSKKQYVEYIDTWWKLTPEYSFTIKDYGFTSYFENKELTFSGSLEEGITFETKNPKYNEYDKDGIITFEYDENGISGIRIKFVSSYYRFHLAETSLLRR
jgi:hypothetical protein